MTYDVAVDPQTNYNPHHHKHIHYQHHHHHKNADPSCLHCVCSNCSCQNFCHHNCTANNKNIIGHKEENRNHLHLKKHKSHVSDLYRIEMEHSHGSFNPPKRFVFDLVDDSPRTPNKSKQSKKHKKVWRLVDEDKLNYEKVDNDDTERLIKKIKQKKQNKSKRKFGKKIDVYYFDHGNAAFYQTDTAPIITSDELAQKTEQFTTKFWAEFFGTLHIGCSFVTTFFLQFLRFILHSIVRPLTIGVIQLQSDYFLKPFLATSFNGIIQPFFILLLNTFSSLRDLCKPIAELFGFFLYKISEVFRAIRLVEINNIKTAKKKTAIETQAV